MSSISSALSGVIGGGLNNILGVDQAINEFEQQVVWPQNLINQARGLVGNLQGVNNQIQILTQLEVNSATLPMAQQLEQNLLSRNPGQIAQIANSYTALYGAVPTPTDASPQQRDMVDMTDAAAQTAMKRAIEIDALADLELQAAGQINQSISRTRHRAALRLSRRKRTHGWLGQCVYPGRDRGFDALARDRSERTRVPR